MRQDALEDLPAAQRIADRGALALLEASDPRRYAADVDGLLVSLLQAARLGRGLGSGSSWGAHHAVGAGYAVGNARRRADGSEAAAAVAAIERALGSEHLGSEHPGSEQGGDGGAGQEDWGSGGSAEEEVWGGGSDVGGAGSEDAEEEG